jgi:mRNA interferase MazF
LSAELTGLRVDFKAQCEQVRAVSKRLGPILGRIPASIMGEMDDALRLHVRL